MTYFADAHENDFAFITNSGKCLNVEKLYITS